MSISFVCQRCLVPIKIHHSFTSIDEHTLAELNLPLYAPQAAAIIDQVVEGVDRTSGTSGFTVVGTSSTISPQEGNQLKTNTDLFDIISNNTEIDHPLCDECCDTLITLLDTELRAAEEESAEYGEFLKRLEKEEDFEDLEGLEEQLRELKKQESKLKGELYDLKQEETMALENLQVNKREYNRLKEQEEEFLKEYCKYKRQISEVEDYGITLDYELKYVDGQLERLEKTNALNATFHIWHSNHFGTINTFRLGRLPSEPVDWNEINAAWGQTALLLNSLARRINFKFTGYQIVPFGNYSYIKVLSDNSEFPLHGTGGFRLLWDTKFDSGMTAFLNCLSQLQTAMLERPGKTGFALPYKMSDKGRIEDPITMTNYSVRTQFNSEENWTKALKFMLTNLKWALAWVSSQTVGESQQNELGFS